MQGRTILDSMFQLNLLKFLLLFVGLAIKFMGLRSEEVQTIPGEKETSFCYNPSFERFRLDAKVLQVLNVPSRSVCINECLVDPCCRAVNFRYNMSNSEPRKCEFLHDVVNTSSGLEEDNSYDYVFFIKPNKEHNNRCLHTEIVDNNKMFYQSCKAIFEKNSSASHGVYTLQLNESSNAYQVYCHMSNLSSQCAGGGWTLVMKLDGNKETFNYDSDLWTNKETFNAKFKAGLHWFTQNETKLASYDNTPFTKICLQMSVNKSINWIMLNYTASSLYSVIKDGSYRKTNLSRAQWESLVDNADLQDHCGLEGFNVHSGNSLKVRIGIVGNNEDHCNSTDTSIGFGIKKWGKELSSGNINTYRNFTLQAFGAVFVQ